MQALLTRGRIIGFFVVIVAAIAAIFTITQVTNGEETPFTLTAEELSFLCIDDTQSWDTELTPSHWMFGYSGTEPEDANIYNLDGDAIIARGTDARLSPDRSQIVYKQGDSLYLINADGSGNKQLTDPWWDAYDESPRWSPNGSKIVFVRNDEQYSNELFMFDLTNNNLVRLSATEHTRNGAHFSPRHTYITWSEDSTRILYRINDGDGNYGLYVTTVFDDSNAKYNPKEYYIFNQSIHEYGEAESYYDLRLSENGWIASFELGLPSKKYAVEVSSGEIRDITDLCRKEF